ncbi:hypothetical protein [Promicromonospora sp. NPDC023805]|uniref:hypothetical protein n=1 Tax=Promicromonospora sp. NPDC023805 TaxID=3154696 RepID=UPI0033FF7B36
MPDSIPCTRCGQNLGFRATRFHYRVAYFLGLRTEVARRYVLRLTRVRDHGWHAETASERVDSMFSELTLCNPCVQAVWDFAQGREAPGG